MVVADFPESSGVFKPEHLIFIYIICIFEDTSDSRFHIWATQKDKEFMEFIKILFCERKMSCDLIRSLTMVPFFNNICDSTAKLFTQIKGKPLIVRKSLKMSLYLWSFPLWQIEDPVNNTAEKMGFKSRHNDKDNNSYVGLFTKPVATCHKCGKRSHIERDLKKNLLWL